MNEQPPVKTEDEIKATVKDREHEFTYLVVPCVETFRDELDWSARLCLAHREDGRFDLTCILVETAFEHMPVEIQKWEQLIKVH